MEVIRKTRSVCPVCLKNIDAELAEENESVYMRKSCPDHGSFSVKIWNGSIPMLKWREGVKELKSFEGKTCPENCGLCLDHENETCCTLIEVTKRCNLNCTYCFAKGAENESDIKIEKLFATIDEIASGNNVPLLQLSGGEPTVRDDLPEIISYAKNAGIKYVQLNSNGLRLAGDLGYVKKLKEAGLSFVFMQFDGVTESVYKILRGKELLELKKKAIENCGKCGLGVTLVPTIVKGVNDDQIGDIVSFAASASPVVRGVHFQPVSYFGRYPKEENERYTLDELIKSLCDSINIEEKHIVPSSCDHPMCGFNSKFAVMPGGELMPISGMGRKEKKTSAEENREFIARHWLAAKETAACCWGHDDKMMPEFNIEERENDKIPDSDGVMDMDEFIKRAKVNSLTITAMAFQDAMNLDVERLRHCSLHVFKDGKTMPFCAAYLTPIKG